MIRPRPSLAALLSLVLLLGAAAGCVALSYDEPAPGSGALAAEAAASEPAWPALEESKDPVQAEGSESPTAATGTAAAGPVPTPAPAPAPAPAEGSTAPARRSTPTRARLEAQRTRGADAETARSWRALTRLARQQVKQGELEQARELLEQAARSLADRRATSTPRRTVFGLRARLANDLAAVGKLAEADALADQLFEEARREPELGDKALVSLAYATAQRRREAARAAGRPDPQLPLLALAFDTAARGTASRERLALAFEVSGLALRHGELDLARRAIDQAARDARLIAPGDQRQTAALDVYRARVELAQHDLASAEASAHAALQRFEEIDADASSRGVAEITLARVLAEKGELESALALARAAYGRLSGTAPLAPHARRQIAAGLARVEVLAGDTEAANDHFREALRDPSDGSALDDDLIRSVKQAVAELETSATTPVVRDADPSADADADIDADAGARTSAEADSATDAGATGKPMP